MTTDVWAISRYEPELEASDLGCEGFEDAEILGICIVMQLNVVIVCHYEFVTVGNKTLHVLF